MKLTVVPCYSYFYKMALEYVKFLKNPYNNSQIYLDELNRREICLSKELIYKIKEKNMTQTTENLQLVEAINNLFDPLIANANQFTPIKIVNKDDCIEQFEDPYEKEIINVANNTKDKIILSDIIEKNYKLPNINIIKTDELKDPHNENILNQYRLPIIKNIRKGENSYKVGRWLERFFYDSKTITIVDPYFYYNIQNSVRYLLNYLDSKVEIKIYMRKLNLGKNTKQIMSSAIRNELQKFSKVKIYIFDETEQHDRFILNENYYIYFGKGLQVLGKGKTHQSEIRINKKEDIINIIIPLTIEEW